MNPLTSIALPDVQAEAETRGICLDEVGISGLSYPLTLRSPDGDVQHTVADAELVVALDAAERGTHMSRFVEALHEYRDELGAESVLDLARDLTSRLRASRARVHLSFPMFVLRRAPVSDAESLLRLDCAFTGAADGDVQTLQIAVRVAVTSLCPCSKEIADYGAHSQRGYVRVEVSDGAWGHGHRGMWFDDLLAVIDEAASAPVYPALKRADERQVTMAAYDKPAFVEDLARDVALGLQSDPRIDGFSVAIENQESIHDHQAVARTSWRRS